MTDLVCRSEQIAEPCDLLSFYRPDEGFFFEHEHFGMVSWGAAVTIRIPPGPDRVAAAARSAAAALDRIHKAGAIAPLVVGALPFDGTGTATLVVPSFAILRRPDGSVWRVVTHPEGEAPPVVGPSAVSKWAPAPLRITCIPSPAAFIDSVATARKRISDGELQKVVLARMLIARAEEPFDRRALLQLLTEREQGTYVFAAHGFVGASPELLVSRFGNQVRAVPVAGTISRGGDAQIEEQAARLLASSKDRKEHALVVEAVRSGLEEVCDPLLADPGPGVLRLRAVLHLATEVRGTLIAPPPTALELAARLHPTPAVSGTPADRAIQLIRELEAIDRTLYAGIVGWTDAAGDGEWAVTLRCAEVQGRIALLFAGAGIVAASDPEAELAETEAKFRTMLGSLAGD